MSGFINKGFFKKIYKYIQWGWNGITVLIYTDITKDPKKLKLNFYSILFPFLIIGILLSLFVYDRIENIHRQQALQNFKKQELLLYNIYYSLKINESLLNNINQNIINLYPKKIYNIVEKHLQVNPDTNLIQVSNRIEEEIVLSNQLKTFIKINLHKKPSLLLEQLWHKSHIYNIIPKGIPMYPGTFSITSGFGYRQDPFHQSEGNFHNGMDFAAPQNTPILAAADGIVLRVFKNTNSGYGFHLILHHGLGFQSLYAHCSQILVEENQFVTEKQIIALVGRSGRATGNHLHYEVRIGLSQPLDPLPFIKVK
ncbi:MAG: peptidase M23 [Leptospiraceae bacterium]|nr:MAG: peptidase M23 [Leptospiraceae bacterium]